MNTGQWSAEVRGATPLPEPDAETERGFFDNLGELSSDPPPWDPSELADLAGLSDEELIARSSLGTAAAREMWESVPDEVVADVVRRSVAGSPVFFLSSRTAEEHGVSRLLRRVLESRFGPDAVAADGRPPASATRAYRNQALLAVIGPQWLSAADGRGRRQVDDPTDVVRTEIAWALRMGMRVVPVLLAGTPAVTARQLPEDLRALTRIRPYRLRDGRTRRDLLRLLDALDPRPGIVRISGSVVRTVDARLVAEVRRAIQVAAWRRHRQRGWAGRLRAAVGSRLSG